MAEQKLMKSHQDLSDFGNRILTEARTELYLAMRFMGRALDSLLYTMDLRTQSIGTDARTIHYNPTFVFHLFIESPQKLDRLYLHIVLHCIFRHMFTSDQYEDEELWGLAADIQVESVLDSMDYDIINRPAYPFREQWYERLKAECKVLTAERIYHYLKQINLDFDTKQLLIQEFHRCDHQFWQKLEERDAGKDVGDYGNGNPDETGRRHDQNGNNEGDQDKTEQKKPNEENESDGQSPENSDNSGRNDFDSDGMIPPELMKDMKSPNGDSGDDANADGTTKSGSGNDSSTRNMASKNGQDINSGNGRDAGNRGRDIDPDVSGAGERDHSENPKNDDGSRGGKGFMQELSKEELDENWQDTAERMKTELETFGAEASEETGSLAWILAAQYRKETDFREFLRKLTILREETRIDPESFDYGYYNYGMEVYGNMPLIEENEFCEDRRISDLVIAIDTSASTKEDQVQKFLNETAAMLRNRANFFKKIRVHVLECDDQVQNDITLSEPEEIEEYAENFSVKGGYGTDFRPVFTYVEKLRKNREIPDLKGMLYFTDGYGKFPEKPTDYDTAFVFDPLSDINDKDVPDWAMKLYLKE